MNNLYVRLHNFLYTCDKTSADYMIARTLIIHYDSLSSILIETIAKEALTTPATVTKFVHKLNYKNFKELREDSTVVESDEQWLHVLKDANTYGSAYANDLFLDMEINKLKQYHEQFQQTQIIDVAQIISNHLEIGVLYPFYGYTSVHAFREYLRPFQIPVHGVLRDSDENYLMLSTKPLQHIFIISLSGDWITSHEGLLTKLKKAEKTIIVISQKDIHSKTGTIDFAFKTLSDSENILQSAIQISHLFAQIVIQLSTISKLGKKCA